jgi:hypothetical protein
MGGGEVMAQRLTTRLFEEDRISSAPALAPVFVRDALVAAGAPIMAGRGERWARWGGSIYYVSSAGRVVSAPHSVEQVSVHGSMMSRSFPARLHAFADDVTPRFGTGATRVDLARAVLTLFDRDPQAGEFAKHRNGDGRDCGIDNLAWQRDIDAERGLAFMREWRKWGCRKLAITANFVAGNLLARWVKQVNEEAGHRSTKDLGAWLDVGERLFAQRVETTRARRADCMAHAMIVRTW